MGDNHPSALIHMCWESWLELDMGWLVSAQSHMPHTMVVVHRQLQLSGGQKFRQFWTRLHHVFIYVAQTVNTYKF